MTVLFKIALAAGACVLIMKGGMVLLRGLARSHEPPPAGELRRVNLRFRCSLCGAEVRMVQASEELPAPPRHCMEDMDLVAPPFE